MSIRGRLRRFAEMLGGLFAVAVGVSALLMVFYISRSPVSGAIQSGPGARVEPIRAGAVSGADLQKRLDAVAAKKQALEEARLARIRAEREAKRKAEEAKEKAAAEKAAKAEAEKAAAQRAAQEKAAKIAAEKAARKKAQQAAKAKAAAKAAAEKARLAALDAVPALVGLASYEAQAAKNAAIAAFRAAVVEKIGHFWSLPDVSGDLRVQLLIRLDRQGRVVMVKVDLPSGCPLCDAQAIRAVREGAPFSLPTNRDALEKLLDEGLLLNFDPHS